MTRSSLALAIAVCLGLSIVGCGDQAAPSPQKTMPTAPPDAIQKVSENGPIKAVVSVWPAAPSVLDMIYLQVEVVAAAGTQATVAFETELLTAFWQDSLWQQDDVARDGGARAQIKVAGLYAEFAGKQRIPSFRIAYVDGAGASHELLTEEISLTIAPPPADAAAATMQPALGPLDAARGAWPWWAWAGLALAGAALAWLAWRGYRAVTSARVRQAQVSAYDQARARLRALMARGAPDGDDADELDAWYVELSAVVRNYIEQRFGLRAPELTTEEFLAVAKNAAALAGPHREQLAAFLEACDRVKFAGYHPSGDESRINFTLAEQFVESTALAQVSGNAAIVSAAPTTEDGAP